MPKAQSGTLINGDLEARQSLWGSLISELEDEDDSDVDDDANENMTAPGLSLKSVKMSAPPSGGRVTPPVFGGGPSPNLSFGMGNSNYPFPAQWKSGAVGGGLGLGAALQSSSQLGSEALSVKDWIAFHRGVGDKKPMDLAGKRKYLEKAVSILHSVVGNVIGGYRNSNSMESDEQIQVHSNFITLENVIVRELQMPFMEDKEITTDFVKCGDSIFCNSGESETRKKYLAMNALGRMAYEMFMLGGGPSSFKFCSKSSATASHRVSEKLGCHDRVMVDDAGIDEDEVMDMFRKNPRTITSEENDGSGLIAAMQDANIPFPLCRFVSDLLDHDRDHVMPERSKHSFFSFADVLADLKQMVDNSNAFLHASSPDRWRLAFGEKLYGREEQMIAFMDAADRIAISSVDPIFCGFQGIAGRRKELVMVGGNSGSGKSRLVRCGGTSLESKGWRFLRCKFDRVVHPEPLSIIAYAFDEFFGSFASCKEPGVKSSDDIFQLADLESFETRNIRQCLESISPEGLGILAKHIPSLRLVLTDVTLPTDTSEVNETRMCTLFGELLQAISSTETPVLLFLDDLQWADPLSLALLTALVKGAGSDHLHLASVDNKQKNQVPSQDENNVMFVGSYRDNEVDDNHPLAKVLSKLQSDVSVNVTNISLSGFTIDMLNEMLSESFRVPVRRVRSLSELVVQKTDGHPLHVIEFIQSLTMDNLLTHSFDRGWEWDADSIDICPITDSVAELFAFKLRRLPKEILCGLQILSCFGSQTGQHVLRFVADYDGDNSVDISAAINVALSEGLVEQAAQFVSFAHDMIQKATIDSISDDDLVPLLRQLASTLIKNSSDVGQLDSVLFVIVDLISRIGSNAIQSPEEREVFAELNSRAGSKAIMVPDFSGAAKYAESGIAFLRENSWETQYDLSLRLYETAVVSHFSSLEGNRDQLKKRINAVFEHGKDFSDKFKTHCVWIKLLSMTDLSRAIEESLNALERLGEPLDLTNVDYTIVCKELAKRKDQFSGDMKQKFLSTNRLADGNKVKSMKIMSSLMVYYHQQKSCLGSYVSCQMIKRSMDYGQCEESVFGAASFAAATANILEDIDEGSAWARVTLSLMEMYDKDTLLPSIYALLYGGVLVWKEPIQSTLEPLARGIRSSFATGNVEFAMINSIYYIARSFNCGKCISVLLGEVKALAGQHGNHFGNDSSSDTPVYSPLLQFYLTPLYNTLRELKGNTDTPEEERASFPLDKVSFVTNEEILKCTLETEQFASLHTILSYQTAKAFVFRDMDSALEMANIYFELFFNTALRMQYNPIYNVFYEGLIAFHFMRQSGDECYLERGESALKNMKEWSTHSDWNFKNKVLLMEAELCNTQKDFQNAAICYEASIMAAQDHKFICEEAIANELAGIFFLDRGLHEKSYLFFKQSIVCYEKWGANAVARRVEESISNIFDSDLMHLDEIETSILSSVTPELPASNKRLFGD